MKGSMERNQAHMKVNREEILKLLEQGKTATRKDVLEILEKAKKQGKDFSFGNCEIAIYSG